MAFRPLTCLGGDRLVENCMLANPSKCSINMGVHDVAMDYNYKEALISSNHGAGSPKVVMCWYAHYNYYCIPCMKGHAMGEQAYLRCYGMQVETIDSTPIPEKFQNSENMERSACIKSE
uniref:Uncharacterized protein n=1 Tax=Nelumbo nucifera TaxID=4432 RepID=A0A822YIW2_NELNU|nr:TPA_asm: hypothetical protein HUJ06_011371 [Nelumbo nucifera]